MKVRRFKICQDGAVMDQSGEFLHINDIMLLLKEERESAVSWMEMYKDSDDDFQVKQRYAYNRQVEFINELIEQIIKRTRRCI